MPIKLHFILIMFLITSGFGYSQKIVIVNPGFEELDSIGGKLLKGWLPGTDDSEVYIPAGSEFAALSKKITGSKTYNLSVDTIPFNGKLCLLLKPNESVLQTLSHPIFQGEHYNLTFYARAKFNKAVIKAGLYFLGGYGREPMATCIFELSDKYNLFSVKCKATITESYGYNIGILFENASENDQLILIDDVGLVIEEIEQ